MILNSKKEQKNELVEKIRDLEESFNELNEEILRSKVKKAEVSKRLSDLQANMIYLRVKIKTKKQELKEL